MNKTEEYKAGKSHGQTIIETIFMLTILLMIFFLIAEFARAWYLKNSLNNAVRVGVRVAVVTASLTTSGIPDTTCPTSGTTGDAIVDAVCTSPGVPGGETVVGVAVTDDNGIAGLNAGDTITLNARANFATVVPGLLTFMPTGASSSATMRFE